MIGRSENYSIQELLKTSALLITDYSSVCYDFAYMYKPVIYYQFDLEAFEKYQYAQGKHFSYTEDGFGEIFSTRDEVIDAVRDAYEHGFRMKSEYQKRVDEFFTYHDSDNRRRVYEENIKGIVLWRIILQQ
jgi:CDP-glycerol glycerophosphotransferase (TagB/SpsB family)